MTKVFQYKLLKDDRLVLTNWIKADSREDALQRLADVKEEMNADTIRLTEVFGARGKCQAMANDRPNLKQIRVKKSVCARLDERKDIDDSYTDVIKALLDENERLKTQVKELKQDKTQLYRLAKIIEVNNTLNLTNPEEKKQALKKLKLAGFEFDTSQ